MNRLFWYGLQVGIVAVIVVATVEWIYPEIERGGEQPPGLHIPVILGVIFALFFTYAISDLVDWARRRKRRRDF